MTYSIRGLSNWLLDRADEQGIRVSNVHVNKVLYFMYVWYLLSTGKKLTSAKIEAWDYGPVFREVYQSFKSAGDAPIRQRAMCLDTSTGERVICRAELTEDDVRLLAPLVDKYIRYRPFDLVELTHKHDTPWDKVYNHGGRSNPGMCISDELIVEYYARQTRQ